jgi:Arc/MetJ family transcription regulator
MRTTLDIDDKLLAEAQSRADASSKTALVEMALRALIRESAYERLIDAGGSMPSLKIPPRRRPA